MVSSASGQPEILNPFKGASYVRTVFLVISDEVFIFEAHKSVLAFHCPLQREAFQNFQKELLTDQG